MTMFERLRTIISMLDETAASAAHDKPQPTPLRSGLPAVLCGAIALAMIAGASAQMGVNEEMTGPIYLQPYQLLHLDGSTTRWSDCSGHFFAQRMRPVFGLCVDGRPLPLLYMLYVPVWTYWPLWWIGTHVANYVPILVNVVPTVVAGALLFLLAFQVLRNEDGRLAWMSVASIALFPFATLYGSLYLYEVVPIAALFAVWMLLDRYNRHAKTGALYLAALIAGFACHQKATAVLVYTPFLVSYAIVVGYRQLTNTKVAVAVAAGLLFPLLGIGLNLAYAAMVEWIQTVGQTTPQISWLQSVASTSFWLFGALPSRGFSMADVVRTVSFFVVMGQCVRLIRRRMRGLTSRRVETLAALTLFGTLTGIVVAYRYNPTSIPSFPLLPWVAILIGGIWKEVSGWMEGRFGERVARVAVVACFTLTTFAVVAIRWPAALQASREMMAYPSFSDQQFATQWLLERNLTEPLMLTFQEKGTVEFLSHGRIRPTYFNEQQCMPVADEEWTRVLDATRDRHVDILIPTPYFAEQQMARQCVRSAAKDFAAVLLNSGRRSTSTLIETPMHTWDFTLFSLDPVDDPGTT